MPDEGQGRVRTHWNSLALGTGRVPPVEAEPASEAPKEQREDDNACDAGDLED